MTLKHKALLASIPFLLIGFTAGTLALGSLRPACDPTNAVAAFCVANEQITNVAPTADEPAHSTSFPGFRLSDSAGQEVAFSDFKDKKAIAIIFVGTECPLVNLYVSRLANLQRELGPRGLQILAINSNSQDAASAIKKHADERRLPFPVLIDPEQKVADLLKAVRTPEAFLLDPTGAVRYHGRIDDQYAVGTDRRAPQRHDLKEAILDVLAGKAVRVKETEVYGCFIGREPVATPKVEITYAKDIAPIMQTYCQECHRPGQVGPFSLLTYEQARRWSATIRELVNDGRMPPWHADPNHGPYANDISLPNAEKKLLLVWIDQGCPKGDDKDIPPARSFPKNDEWRIGKPDLVLTMKEKFTIPAAAPEKGIDYQRYVLPTNFEEDVWVQAVEAKPDARAVVHHMLVYIGEQTPASEGESRDIDVLCSYVPGSKPSTFPPGLAKRIPKGAKLILEMHYTANGTEQVDQSSIAMIFSKEPPKHEFRSRFIANRKFTIPPHASNHAVSASTTFDKDALILTLSPHMHLRGKSFLFRAIYPDGRTETVLSVPRYDFNWQHAYALKTPLQVPAGTRIECVGHFDNSAKNRNNPDATTAVRWGDQSWEEMMLGVIGYVDLQSRP